MYTSTSLPSVKLRNVLCNSGKAGSKYTQSAAKIISGEARCSGIGAALKLAPAGKCYHQSSSEAMMREIFLFRSMLRFMISTIFFWSVI